MTITRKPINNVIRDSAGDRIFLLVVTVITFIVLCIVLYPLVFVFSASLSSGAAVMAGRVVLWPVDFSLEGYRLVFEDANIMRGFRNTVVYTTLGTSINIVMTTLIAFPLSRKQLPARRAIMFFVTFTMLFSGGMIPTFLVVERLGMVDTIWAMVIPSAISTFNLIIMRTYFEESIPEELYESASMDGCSNFRFLLAIAIPLSKAVIAVLVLFYAVGHWNQFFHALLYLRSNDLINLQLVLRNILMANQIAAGGDGFGEVARLNLSVRYAVIIFSIVPVFILYPFIQKYFTKGVMIGAIKG